MSFDQFESELRSIAAIANFEKKLDDLDVDYPSMSTVAARILEYAVTGVRNEDGLISWWLFTLNCGKDSGDLVMPDNNVITVRTAGELWAVLTDSKLYAAASGDCWEQMEFDM